MLKKRNGVYYVHESVNGIRIRESLHTADKILAQSLANQRISEVIAEKVENKTRLDTFAKEYVEWSRTNKATARQEEGRLNHVLDFFKEQGLVNLADVTP